MAVSFSCQCAERKKPVRERKWRVSKRNCHYSAFSGYHCTPSDYSTVWCLVCGVHGRTKAKYVDRLPDITDEEMGMVPSAVTKSGGG